MTDQRQFTTWYEYDQAGFLTKVIDRNNIANDIYQDKRGNTLGRKYCRAAGECAIEYWTYYLNENDPFDPRNDQVIAYRDGRSASDTDPTHATTTEYNSFGEQTKVTTPATDDFPQGRSESIAYTDGSEPAEGGGTTPAGLTKSKTDARGNTWQYRYTAAGDLAEQTDPEGLVTKLDYDALGRVIASTRVSDAVPNGAKTTFAYDGWNRLTASTAPGVKNEISNVTHTGQTRTTYDPDGNPLTQTIADLTGGEQDRVTTYTYDSHGRQDSLTGPEGGIARQEWNHRGQVIRTTDARGTVIEQAYTVRGELYTSTLKGWTGSPVNPQPATDVLLETRSYDAGGRLDTIKDVMGRTSKNTYWMDNRLKEQIAVKARLNDPAATPRDVQVKAEEYDAAGNLITQVGGKQANGQDIVTIFEYDQASRLVTQVLDPRSAQNPKGLERVTEFGYDANGNVTKATRRAAESDRVETTSYAYNKLNQQTRQTIENGAQDIVSTIEYDDRGLPVATTDPRGNADGANAADYTTTIRYDILDRLVESKAPQVQVDKNGSAASARPSALVGYDTVGNQTHQRDAEGRIVTSTFDKAGRLVSSTAPAYTPPGGSTIISTVEHAYDKAGQRIRTTDSRDNVTTYEYDQLGRQVRVTDPAPDGQSPGTWVTEYDMAGEKLATVDPTGARAQATYDDLGRQITATQIERKPASAAYTTKMEYDDAGRLVKQIVPGTGTTTKTASFEANAAGETTKVTDPAGASTMEYDLAGRLVKTTDANGNASVAEYDLAGRKTTVTDLGRNESSNNEITVERTYGMGYDAAGNQISATSPEGYVTRQTFDALGRLTSLVEPVSTTESITTSFGYDATGARTRITDGRGNATWTSYNSLGLVETVTEPSTTAHPNAAERTWTHAYDAAGNPTTTIQPGGVRIDRIFDHLGRLTKESGAGGGATTAERTFGYDLAGRRTTAGDLTVDYNDRSLPLKVSRGTVQETTYAYDGIGSPVQRIDASGTATFTYDGANRLKTATDPVTSRTLTYGYDAASRLKTITATGTASTQTIDYYDTNQVKSQTLKNGSGTQLAKIAYEWDKDDNLTTKTTAGTAGAGTNTYGYDHAGRLTSWTAPGGATTAYEWDAAGNRTKAGDKTFTYDERNRLTSGDGTDYTYTPRGTLASSSKAGATINYTFDAFDRLIADGDSLYSYDALDRMTSRIRGTAKQGFAYSGLGNDLAAITDSGGTVQAKYSRDVGGSLLGLQEGTGAAVAALSDLHGDLVATFTSTLQTSAAYDPFGTVTAQTGSRTQLGYQGEYADPDTGKVNMHARWYQPGTGTFTSRDTATLNPNPSVQANRYTYANATPLTGIDPTGHMTMYSLDGSGGYSPSGGSDGRIGPNPGQLIIGTTEYNDLITAPGGYGNVESVDPSWARMIQLENEKKFWLGDDEIARLGMKVMPNGRPVDQPNFWFASEKVQNEYMSNWSPTMTDKQLAFSWVAAGGLESFATMEKAAKKNANDVRLGEWRKMQQVGGKLGSGMYATKPKDGTSASRYASYESYKYIVRYWRDIEKAAANHGIKDVNALAAVLMYESHWQANQTLGAKAGDNLSFLTQGEGASIGVGQLEIYKIRHALNAYAKGFAAKNYSNGEIADMMKNPSIAIHAAAAYMRYLKERITGLNRPMTDMDAAIAYCTCSGAVVDPKTGVVSAKRYVAWANSGYVGRPEATKKNPENGRIAEERRNALLAYVKAAPELFACGRAACWTYM
ncbi:RHS repeat-associated core domain-containing protein [Nonomuraea sp. NPDC049784]|uniref:RHS repeat-associated core domain-containing protein n=1 Tax=Nonomuraea sp. NPDC049784 TaxID=3154361 RepID=UPI0033D6D74E